MFKSPVRKVQLTCFLLAHIPLAACVSYFAIGQHPLGTLLAVAFPATLVTAILLVAYIGRVLPRIAPRTRDA